jgi:hypothetical protein
MKLNLFLAGVSLAFGVTASVPTKDQIHLLKDPSGKSIPVKKQDVYSLARLENLFMMDSRHPGLALTIKRHALHHRSKCVPLLIKVMKDAKFPEQNRWQATMLLGQIMGKKSAPFIAKFSQHPHSKLCWP